MDKLANPTLIQKGNPSRAPLFLIHDASGRVHNYLKLEDIGRPVYAISNPWMRSKVRWEGGTSTLVEEHVKLIKSVVSKGDILVGGWSIGGQLGIDIGRVLAQNSRSRLRVVGVVLIDTLYPYWGGPETEHAEISVDLVLESCPADMKEAVLRSMQWSKQDSLEWAKRNSRENKDEVDGIEAEDPPPAVLLYAAKYVPVTNAQNGAVAMADYQRNAKNGWDMFPHHFILATWELSAHHFGLFGMNVVKETSKKIKEASDLLAED